MPLPGPPAPSIRARRLKLTALLLCIVLAIVGALVGLRSPMLHQYEYQEDLYVFLDGSASVYVSASQAALVALDGMDLSTDPASLFDRGRIRQLFSGPGVTVSAIRSWRRWGRRFVTVRVDTPDIRRLPASLPFSHAAFEFGRDGNGYRLVERLGPSINRPVTGIGWDGAELVGFRWHLPSRVETFNTPQENYLRGNILVWEQTLAKRLAGEPLEMRVRMEGRSILYGALWLFGVSAASALVVVGLIVWWVVSKGRGRKAVT